MTMINYLKIKVCYIHMVLDEFDQETTTLNPDKLNMISPTELSQYFIKDWQLKYFKSGTFVKFQCKCNTTIRKRRLNGLDVR